MTSTELSLSRAGIWSARSSHRSPDCISQFASHRQGLSHFAILTALFLGAIALPVQAELIPAKRLIDWTPGVSVGVPGGIPTNRTHLIDVTQAPYNADPTGVANASSAIQAAVNAAVAGDVVYLPPGRYRFTSTVNIPAYKPNITIRGSGLTTVIDMWTSTAFFAGPTTDYAWAQEQYAEPKVANTISAGLTQGSTSLTIPSTTPFAVGQIIQISLQNQDDPAALAAGATPVVSTLGYPTIRRQMSRIIGKTSSTLSIFPAVHFTADAGLVAKVHHLRAQLEGFGLEDLHIDCSNFDVNTAVILSQCYGSWIKGVKISRIANYGFYIVDSLNCEMRKSIVAERKSAGTNGAGLLLGHVGQSLFEDNIIYGVAPPVEVNFSSTGNVLAYNFLYSSLGGNLNMNHGPHNSFNLYEGNITPNIQPDGYFGSTSDDTIFRNWITGNLFEAGTYTFMISLNRFTRNYSLVGNILGTAGWPYGPTSYSFGNPNMGNGSFTGTAQPSSNILWSGWKATAELTARHSDSTGAITISSGGMDPNASEVYPQLIVLRAQSDPTSSITIFATSQSGSVINFKNSSLLPAIGAKYTVWWCQQGYQESDLDVERTTIRKANYHAWSAGGLAIPAAEVVAPETLPASLFRAAKPEWFGNLSWPPFNPFSPNPTNTSIPAGYRYINNGAEPPSSANTAPLTVRIFRR